MKQPARQVAVVGAGWAGCAAAVELSRRGHQVHLVEASRLPGGRARGQQNVLTTPHASSAAGIPSRNDGAPDPWHASLDNGQHLLLGAYTETLRLMRLVGVDMRASLLRLPLQMRYPAGSHGMDFQASRLPAPLHMLMGLLRSSGLGWSDQLSLMRFLSTARWMDWRLHDDCSVDQLLERFDQTKRVCDLLWRPLCLAALNTPSEHASAQVFLSVLHDSLGAKRAASDMLVPRVDLSTLFPLPAMRYVQSHGGSIHLGRRVTELVRTEGRWHLLAGPERSAPELSVIRFDAVILATPVAVTTRLLTGWTTDTTAYVLQYEPIITCYLQYPPDTRLPHPFYALIDTPDSGMWGQFVFDKGQLDVTQKGLMAVVISAASHALTIDQAELGQALAQQLATAFDNPVLRHPERMQLIAEKRATFSCRPGLTRPPTVTGVDGLLRAGDYVASAYPATIESAVQSGVQAARLIDQG